MSRIGGVTEIGADLRLARDGGPPARPRPEPPMFPEVDESLTLDPDDVAQKIGPRTKAILPVHMRGAPADIAALTALAREHGLVLVEDVCQSAGASYRGRRLGTFGDAGAFSLQ